MPEAQPRAGLFASGASPFLLDGLALEAQVPAVYKAVVPIELYRLWRYALA